MKKNRKAALLLAVLIVLSMFTSCRKTVVAMEYKGETVSVNMYSYWMSRIKSNYVSSSDNTDEYWDTVYDDGLTYENKMREIVDFYVKVNVVCQKLFKDMGLSISDAEKSEIDSSLSDLLLSYGSKSELNSVLSAYNINYDILKDIYNVQLRTSKVYDALYKSGGQRMIDDAHLDKYYRENYALLDVIVISGKIEYEKDADGNPVVDENTGGRKTRELSEEESAAKKALVDDIMKKLGSGEDFSALKSLYNEDPQKDVYKDGYYMSANDIDSYGTDIIIASQKMNVGDYQMIETGSTYYIVKRLELKEKPYVDETYSVQFSNLLDYCEQDDFNQYMSELIEDVVVNEKAVGEVSVKKAPLINV